jgi:hypothetical protein
MTAIAIRDINITGRCTFPRPRRPAPVKRELLGPIEDAWQRGEPAFEWSPESMSRTPALVDPSTQSWAEIASTQPVTKDPDKHARLNPFRPIRTDRFEIPSEHRLAAEAGITMLNIDGPVAGTTSITVADTIADDFDGPAPYVMPDPRVEERILWEQMTTKSGPVTRIRRKLTGERDIVVVDRPGEGPGHPPLARMRGARLPDGTVCIVFEQNKPYIYARVRDAYIRRMARLNDGRFPTWAEQKAMAENGRIEQQMRVMLGRPRLELADRPDAHDRLTDRLDHEPYEDHEGPDNDAFHSVAEELGYRLETQADVDALLPEDFDLIEETWWNRLTPEQRQPYLRRHLRTHSSWEAAQAAQLHIGEYLASDEDILG